MKSKRFVLANVLIEVDAAALGDGDTAAATRFVNSRLRLGPGARIERLDAYVLAGKPDARDETVEEYHHAGMRIAICQSADTVGSATPRYFAVVWNDQAKQPTGSLVDVEGGSLEELKAEAEARATKKAARFAKRRAAGR